MNYCIVFATRLFKFKQLTRLATKPYTLRLIDQIVGVVVFTVPYVQIFPTVLPTGDKQIIKL